MRRPVEFADFPAELAMKYGPYRAIVRHVVDGDTIDCLIDVGFNDYLYRVIRLSGIDAPEKNRAATMLAGKRSQEYLAALLPTGTGVLLYTDPDPDSFGRYIARVYTVENKQVFMVNNRMVEAGHAVTRSYE